MKRAARDITARRTGAGLFPQAHDRADSAPATPRGAKVFQNVRRTAVAAAALLAGGCLSPHQSAVADVDAAAWNRAAVLTLTNSDTTTLRDLELFLRCNDLFTEDSLTVRITVLTPDSLRHEEPFLLVIPPAHTPAALSREADVAYRRRVRFARTGDYRIKITPGRLVKGVEAVGINIVKSQ
ncbi:hypothetical protein [Alistipes sp.]|uniref:hypothetical protein n=1 Tax=Alistipes sp. TaxID=1872444 RepID=UPI003AB66F58